ncbi:MAG: glycoside hydrolase family 95 protein [Clostridia bacterium]|nr:glycoside hydrolase family 95 protein [Clostridia bacterium]
MSIKKLHFTEPGRDFEDGSPVGCGNLGAMLLGDTADEKIWLTHESIWSGGELDGNDANFRNKVDTLRKMYLDGEIGKIDKKANEIMNESIHSIKSIEYAGLLHVNLGFDGKTENYTRDLTLNTGVFDVSFTKNGCMVSQQAFASYSFEAICVRYSFSTAHDISFYVERENILSSGFENDILFYTGATQTGGHRFKVGIKLVTDGKSAFADNKVTVKNANDVQLYISIATDFDFGDEYDSKVDSVLDECGDYDEMLANHCDDFSSLFERSDIVFKEDEELEKLSVKERLARLKEDENARDYGLIGLYYAFGKYLLISSSREGTLPANLQGVWVEKLNNKWNSDYHTNINLQMNYWLAEVANLSECHLPLFDYMNNLLLPAGQKTAEVNYRCRGTVVHHLSDIYGYTAPADGLWGIWPLGGAWLSTHMWEHYLYTLDEEFLRNEAYTYMKECVLFFLDYLFEDKDGRLISGPSMSPENLYYIDTPEGKKQTFVAFSPTMDIEVITAVFKNYIEAEKILCIDSETASAAAKALTKLPKLKVGSKGQLLEWLEEFEEPEPGHRHISHAFALYPDNLINENTPELFKAIRKTLDIRLSHGGGHTGWSRAWLINLFARLKDGNKTFENIRLLFTKSTADSMLDIHPPFQIDGNFGGAAGIAEALMQSHEGYISLLPAVKDDICGSFRGLKARGDFDVDAEFKNGKVVSFKISSDKDKAVKVKIPACCAVTCEDEKLSSSDGIFTIKTNAEYKTA